MIPDVENRYLNIVRFIFTGTRRKVSGSKKLPANFEDFLRDSHNKEEMFALLTKTVAESPIPAGKEVYITDGMCMHNW